MIDQTFSDLGLPQELVHGVEALGFEAPSAIQAAAIPTALEGKDLVGLSETGSGKTAAFGLPTLARVDTQSDRTQALVVCPTRELAVQVCAELQRLGSKLKGLHATAIYGGAPMDRQIRALRHGVHIVVGTPGRLIDHVKRGTLDLSEVKVAVLDEADRMLDMGFVEEMEDLLRALPEERQTLFFSATMNRSVSGLIDNFGDRPETIQIERKSLTVESIEQTCFEVRHRSRIELISRIVDLEDPRLTLVFCNTKRAVDECTEALLSRGYSADRLHGDIAQSMRERVLRLFREGTVEILVATDVAARGIDIDEIDLVINYELPQDPEDYVHRVGRTGRAGRVGKAVSFIYGRDAYRIKTIERFIRQPIPKSIIPTQADVDTHLAGQMLETLSERLQAETNEATIQSLAPLREAGYDWDDIAGALMEIVNELTAREGEEILEDKPKPERARRDRNEDRRRDFDPEQAKGKKREQRPRRSHDAAPESGMVRLFLSLGKRDRITVKDIVGMLHNECHLEPGTVGHIKLMPGFSFVEIQEGSAEQAIQASSHAKLRGRPFKLDFDRGRDQGQTRKGSSRSDDSRPRKPSKGNQGKRNRY
ncbi:MAG: DEAD/DEAH box helicase [Verrucomicrobiota bacterium]